ncbi:sugar transferase [Lysinimonas soli]|uniref:Sugar transferase n=1 Tax=Lysinimonas soli TaxID=1074233 RepID=A0ABW0NLH7_9MICO
MSGVVRGVPLAYGHARDLIASPPPRATDRVAGVDQARKDVFPNWARRQVLARRLTDLAAVTLASASSVGVAVVFGLRSDLLSTTDVVVSIVVALGWFAALRVRKASELRTAGRGAELDRAIVSTLVAFGLLAVINGFVRIDGFQAYLVAGLPIGVLLLVVSRVFWQRRLDADRAAGLSLPRALIVGAGPDIDFVAEQLARAAVPKYVVAGVVFSDGLPESDSMTAAGFPAFDGIAAVTDAIAIANADVVILAGQPGDGGEFVRALSWRLETSSAELVLAWCLDSIDRPRLTFDTANGMPLMHVAAPRFSGAKHHAKRAMDVLLAGGALLALLPLFGIIALLVRRDSEGPVFFRQERVGLGGRTFSMIKFRSMVVTAEADLAALADQNEGNGVLFKLRADPRVTRIGAVLRRYSLDELPQLWNIFVGDMSLVGPRPPLVREVEQYDSPAERRLYVKPGLTGAWQVGGRSDLSWEESIRLDLHYVENWSLLGDIRIMWRTVGVMIKPVGAY